MKLNDFKIGTRLGTAFAAMVLLSMAMAAIALYALHSVESNLDDVVLDNNVKIKLNNDMSESVHIVSRVTRTIVLLDDKPTKNAELEKVVKARAGYDKAWDALSQFPASETGKANRAKIKEAADAARALNSRVLALGFEGSKDAEAVTLLMK